MRPSPGTAKTTVEGLHLGALVRRDGRIVALPGPRTRELPFPGGARFGMSIPWGDLVTAFHSTGIPNITVYTSVSRGVARMAPMLRFWAPLLRMPAIVRFLQKRVEGRATGPTGEQRRRTRMSIWGRVENSAGASVDGSLDVPEAYELTTLAALESAVRVLRGDVPAGATTPSKAFGPDFVTTLPGVGPFIISR